VRLALCNNVLVTIDCVVQCFVAWYSELQCVAVCCSVLQTAIKRFPEVWEKTIAIHLDWRCITMELRYSSVLQRVAACCSVLQCIAVCCSVLPCVAVCCSVLQCVAVYCSARQCECCSVLQCVAMCCSVLQRVAACCSVVQCIKVCCSVL